MASLLGMVRAGLRDGNWKDARHVAVIGNTARRVDREHAGLGSAAAPVRCGAGRDRRPAGVPAPDPALHRVYLGLRRGTAPEKVVREDLSGTASC